MAEQVFPTKGNLINTKNPWRCQSRLRAPRPQAEYHRAGDDDADRPRLRHPVPDRFDLRAGLSRPAAANVAHGICDDIADAVPVENGLSLSSRSVMGVEIPIVHLDPEPVVLSYGFMNSSALIDEAYIRFDQVKKLTAELAEVENSVYRLATAVNKTQKRANALKNIILPRLTSTVKYITDSLEEKEREDFSRLKVIKAQKKTAQSRP